VLQVLERKGNPHYAFPQRVHSHARLQGWIESLHWQIARLRLKRKSWDSPVIALSSVEVTICRYYTSNLEYKKDTHILWSTRDLKEENGSDS